MTVSSKLLAGVFAAVCFSHSPAFANRIYQMPSDVSRIKSITAFSVLAITTNGMKNPLVVDSIPQLGIVVTRTPLTAQTLEQAGVDDLGDVGGVHLIAPKVAALSKSPLTSLWGLKAIHLAKAWKVSKGAGVIVAVSDTGVSADHSALASQMWKNPGEVGVDAHGKSKSSNAVDDDKNGYVDDVYGWDFAQNKGGGVDHHYHGTHVAGTIAASFSKSMTGIAPEAKIMDVSFLDKNGSGDDVSAAKTLVYAVDHGAKIINCSWGGGEKNLILEKAIQYAHDHGVLVIAAAGNDGANNDQHLFTPSGYAYDNIISVGATSDASGSVASFSNYGQLSVDLAAPGEEIYSLAPHNGHQTLSGTSMATPHVAGVAALVWSAHPRYTWAQVRNALMADAPVNAWKKKSVSGGILEADLAVIH